VIIVEPIPTHTQRDREREREREREGREKRERDREREREREREGGTYEWQLVPRNLTSTPTCHLSAREILPMFLSFVAL